MRIRLNLMFSSGSTSDWFHSWGLLIWVHHFFPSTVFQGSLDFNPDSALRVSLTNLPHGLFLDHNGIAEFFKSERRKGMIKRYPPWKFSDATRKNGGFKGCQLHGRLIFRCELLVLGREGTVFRESAALLAQKKSSFSNFAWRVYLRYCTSF